ncbi:hypothetical protein PJ985_03150 [Streptomyces sp. ACA25]|uniref:hypothetical protein n=1 Tax=Streptomyces sp. ACA25 TaxID=3022596 RepID=UPI0023073E54|nr:hypothetical protein [Streptomyces sp. ACA25]MDB1086563.1 hypothetical protein [Streptomyces sp. ACA25]
MSTGYKTMAVFVTVLSGLLLTIIGVTAEWPPWAWPALAVLMAGAPALVLKVAALRRTSLPADLVPYLPAVPVERREQQVVDVALPSQWDDYDFLFSGTVRWCPRGTTGTDPLVNPAGLAVEAVLARARTLTEQREPARVSLVQHELSGALSTMQPEPTGHLQVMAEGITLTLTEQDHARLETLAEVRKDESLWEHRRKHEQSKRQYLGEDVLKDTGSAVIWWLAKNEDQVEKAVGDIGLLAQLTSAANDADIPERLRHLVPGQDPAEPEQSPAPFPDDDPRVPDPRASAADHYDAFLRGMGLSEGDVRRTLLTKQIAHYLRTQDRHETADEISRRYDPPAAQAAQEWGTHLNGTNGTTVSGDRPSAARPAHGIGRTLFMEEKDEQ